MPNIVNPPKVVSQIPLPSLPKKPNETREIMINVALIGIGCLIFGVMLMMSAIILFTVVTIIREK